MRALHPVEFLFTMEASPSLCSLPAFFFIFCFDCEESENAQHTCATAKAKRSTSYCKAKVKNLEADMKQQNLIGSSSCTQFRSECMEDCLPT